MLPEKDRYCPPLTFRVEDVRSFNRRALCGTHIVNSLLKFLQDMKEFEGEETAGITRCVFSTFRSKQSKLIIVRSRDLRPSGLLAEKEMYYSDRFFLYIYESKAE